MVFRPKIMGDVPPYSELGKNARNIFQTGYLYGKNLVKLALKTKTEKVLEIGSDFTMDFDATKVQRRNDPRKAERPFKKVFSNREQREPINPLIVSS